MEQKLTEWRNREALRVAARTLEIYEAEMKRFATWGGSPTSTAADLDRYLAERKARNASPTMLNHSVSALKSFFRFLGNTTAEHLHAPPVPRTLQRTLKADEIVAVLASPDTATPKGKRDVAIIGLVVASGLRATEVCQVRLADVDMNKRLFTAVVKGGQTKWGTFDEYAAALLQEWLAVRPGIAAPDADTLFVSLSRSRQLRGRALTRQAIRVLCRELAKKAGIEHFSPHALRRSFATLATEFGCPTRLLQDAGRWEDLEQLEWYAHAIRLKAFEQYSPLARVMKGG